MTRAERLRAVRALQREAQAVRDRRAGRISTIPTIPSLLAGGVEGGRDTLPSPVPPRRLASGASVSDTTIDRRDLEPGPPSLAVGVKTDGQEGIYPTDSTGVVRRPSHASPETNTTIDAAVDYNPDAAHAAWLAKRLGLHGWSLGVFAAGTEEDPQPDDEAKREVLAFADRVFVAYGGGIGAMLDVAFDSTLRRGAAAPELDIADSLDDVYDVDFVDPTVFDVQVVKDGPHRRLTWVYRPASNEPPKVMNPNSFGYFGINQKVGQPHGQSPFLALVDTAFPQHKLRETLGKVAANHGWARILLILDYVKTAMSAGHDVVRPTENGGFEVLDPVKFKTHMDKARNDLSENTKQMYADDTWVVYDAVKPDTLGANHGQQSLKVGEVSQLFDTDQIMALHGQPTIFGRNWGAALSTTGDVQWMVYALGLEALRMIPARAVEFILNQYLRIRGIPAFVTISFEDIRKEDRKAEAEAAKLEVERLQMLRQLGWIDDDEGAQAAVGHDAPEQAGPAAEPAPAPDTENAAPAQLALPEMPAPPVHLNGNGRTNGHVHDPATALHPEWTEVVLAAEPFVPNDPDVAGEVELVGGATLDDTDARTASRAFKAWAEANALATWGGIIEAVAVSEESETDNGHTAYGPGRLSALAAPRSEWKSGRWQWSPAQGRYRYPPTEDGKLGRLVAPRDVRRVMERRLASAERQAGEIARQMTDGKLTPRQFQGRMKDLLADVHLQARMLGTGGRAQMTRADYEATGQLWRADTQYMARFAQSVANGEAGSAAQIQARARSYMDATCRNEYEQGRLVVDRAVGMNEEIWITTTGDSCDDCRALAARGWVPIGTSPQLGTNACHSRCGCRLERRRVDSLVPA